MAPGRTEREPDWRNRGSFSWGIGIGIAAGLTVGLLIRRSPKETKSGWQARFNKKHTEGQERPDVLNSQK